jgi:hypothetical protein
LMYCGTNPRRNMTITAMAATMILLFMCGLPFERTSRLTGTRNLWVVASQTAARYHGHREIVAHGLWAAAAVITAKRTTSGLLR